MLALHQVRSQTSDGSYYFEKPSKLGTRSTDEMSLHLELFYGFPPKAVLLKRDELNRTAQVFEHL
jgi:hypothetical protein